MCEYTRLSPLLLQLWFQTCRGSFKLYRYYMWQILRYLTFWSITNTSRNMKFVASENAWVAATFLIHLKDLSKMFLLILRYWDILRHFFFFMEANNMNMFLEKGCTMEAKNTQGNHLILVYIICNIGYLSIKANERPDNNCHEMWGKG